MDAKPLYPDGHHPVRLKFAPDGMHRVTPLPRAGRSIRYYYIDFGLALQFQPGVTPTALGRVGRDREVPELSDTVPYDPFKVDIFALGHLYSQEFEKVRAPDSSWLVNNTRRSTRNTTAWSSSSR